MFAAAAYVLWTCFVDALEFPRDLEGGFLGNSISKTWQPLTVDVGVFAMVIRPLKAKNGLFSSEIRIFALNSRQVC